MLMFKAADIELCNFTSFLLLLQIHASCKIVNKTDSGVVHYGECYTAKCDMGPLTYTHCDGTPMEAWFCRPGRRLLHEACK